MCASLSVVAGILSTGNESVINRRSWHLRDDFVEEFGLD